MDMSAFVCRLCIPIREMEPVYLDAELKDTAELMWTSYSLVVSRVIYSREA